ncbi:MAG: Gfo/Idh/MocA family oxidoreductase [Clostridia bacterium]|nr:Gfo/Idh/MocA family oxidoreductase [Clostridia bacterium]
MINALFAGCGRISDLHALGYANNGKASIYGLYDPDHGKAEEKAKLWKAKIVYNSYEEALADPAIDLVEILTPHYLHCPMAVEAANAGKHISLQKPMALTLDEADQIITAASRAGVVLRIYENFVYYPPYVKARELIESGEIGEPLSFNLRVRCGIGAGAWNIPLESWQWRFNPQTGGGCPIMFDHNYHNFSLALYLLGAVEKVTAWIDQSEIVAGSGLMVNVPAVVMWKYRLNRAYGVMDVVLAPELEIETHHYADESRLEITGTKGIIMVNRCTGRLQNRPPIELYRDGITTAYENIPAGWEISFIRATGDMIDALKEGRQPRLSGTAGKAALELTLAVQESAYSNRAITLDPANTGKEVT